MEGARSLCMGCADGVRAERDGNRTKADRWHSTCVGLYADYLHDGPKSCDCTCPWAQLQREKRDGSK